MKPMKCKNAKFFLADKRFWLDLAAPNRCPFCNEIILWDEICCNECEKNLPYIDMKTCMRCGKANCICSEKLFYDRCVSIVWYDKNMQSSVVRFKVSSPDNFAEFFAEKLFIKLKEEGLTEFDAVSTAPMSKRQLKRRGYNQAAVLGKALAGLLEIPFDENLLIKKNDDIAQHTLNSAERFSHARKSFEFNFEKCVKDKKILFCDDIITTGSTFNACAEILKNNGAKFVCCAAACNTK